MREREDYVRPPLVAFEPPSATLVRWRYRVVAGLLVLLAVLLLTWVFLRFSGITGGEDPGLIGTHGAALSSSALLGAAVT